MTSTRRLELLREYGMLQAQVLELQRQMAKIEGQFGQEGAKGRYSGDTKVGKVRAWVEAQKGEFTTKEANEIADKRAVGNTLFNMKKEGKIKRVGSGRYKLVA